MRYLLFGCFVILGSQLLRAQDKPNLSPTMRMVVEHLRPLVERAEFVIAWHHAVDGICEAESIGELHITRYRQDLTNDRDARAVEEWTFRPPYRDPLARLEQAICKELSLGLDIQSGVATIIRSIPPDLMFRYSSGDLLEWRHDSESNAKERWRVIKRNPLGQYIHPDYLKLVGWDCAYGWGWDTDYGLEQGSRVSMVGDQSHLVVRSDCAVAARRHPQYYVGRHFTPEESCRYFSAVRTTDVSLAPSESDPCVIELIAVPRPDDKRHGLPSLAVSRSLRLPEPGCKVPGIHYHLLWHRGLNVDEAERLQDLRAVPAEYPDVAPPSVVQPQSELDRAIELLPLNASEWQRWRWCLVGIAGVLGGSAMVILRKVVNLRKVARS